MDLKLNPAKEDQLIHPYNQVRSLPNSNRREIRVFNFATPDFGQRNQIQLQPMDMRITEMYVEFELAAETDASNPKWEPTTTWLTLQGIDLLYKNFSVLNMGEPEATMATILDERENVFDAKQDIYSFSRRTNNADVPTKLYLPLNHLCNQVLSKIGALSAYQAGDWSLAVELRPILECISAASSLAGGTTASITRMRLICIGAKVPVGEVLLQKNALHQNGIVWNFLRSHRFRDTIPVTNIGNTSTITRTFTSIKGNISHVRQCHRDRANYIAVGTTEKNNIDWDQRDFYGVNSRIEVGKISKPTDVFGQAVYPPLINTFFMKSNMGQSTYAGLGGPAGRNIVSEQDTGIRDISFAESVCDVLHGTSTGSYPVDSDFRISLTIAPDEVNTVAQLLDTVVYTHVRGVLTAKTININTSH